MNARSLTYRVDIDETIATPRFYAKDLQTCCQWYVQQGIVTSEEVADLQRHQQLFLLPQVLLTHVPLEGAVEALQRLVQQGETVQYFSVRQAIDPETRRLVHQNTRNWLATHHFPCATDAYFFWDAGDKLTQSLEAIEERILVIDDRPAGLVEAYQKITHKNLHTAQQIQQRVTVLAFGMETVSPELESEVKVIACPSWSCFFDIRASLLSQ